MPILSKDNIIKILQSLSEEVKTWQTKKKQKYMMNIAEILRDSKQDGEMLLIMFGYWNNVVKQVQTMKTKKAAKKEKNKLVRKERIKRENSYLYDETLDIPKKTKIPEKSQKKKGTWIIEDNNIIDFLESSATTHVVTTNPGKKRKKDENLFPITDDGRLIINDPDQINNISDQNTEQMKDSDPYSDYVPLFEKSKIKKRKSLKNSKQTGISKKQLRRKKAGGDVKKKNDKYEPYAYLPLKAGQLNKRRRLVAHKTYKHILSKPSITGRGIRKK